MGRRGTPEGLMTPPVLTTVPNLGFTSPHQHTPHSTPDLLTSRSKWRARCPSSELSSCSSVPSSGTARGWLWKMSPSVTEPGPMMESTRPLATANSGVTRTRGARACTRDRNVRTRERFEPGVHVHAHIDQRSNSSWFEPGVYVGARMIQGSNLIVRQGGG